MNTRHQIIFPRPQILFQRYWSDLQELNDANTDICDREEPERYWKSLRVISTRWATIMSVSAYGLGDRVWNDRVFYRWHNPITYTSRKKKREDGKWRAAKFIPNRLFIKSSVMLRRIRTDIYDIKWVLQFPPNGKERQNFMTSYANSYTWYFHGLYSFYRLRILMMRQTRIKSCRGFPLSNKQKKCNVQELQTLPPKPKTPKPLWIRSEFMLIHSHFWWVVPAIPEVKHLSYR